MTPRPLCLLGLIALSTACDSSVETASLEVWHGTEQRVGHLGDAQPDFNLMGRAVANELVLVVNGGAPRELTLAEGRFGFRRLGTDGHFNADVPIESLTPGVNTLELIAKGSKETARQTITLRRESTDPPGLPFEAFWPSVTEPQDVGQFVDGEWELDGQGDVAGLRSRQPLYDRLFLIGNRTWSDYEVRTSIIVHEVAGQTGPHSGAPGAGLIFRFQGHSVDPPRFPDAQPKWGFQPFGAILWLRWNSGPDGIPSSQFYRGDRNESSDVPGTRSTSGRYHLRAQCTTDPDHPETTTYRLKVWPFDSPDGEPSAWALEIPQSSATALRSGGVALVAHHVDVTFGNVDVRPVTQAR